MKSYIVKVNNKQKENIKAESVQDAIKKAKAIYGKNAIAFEDK